MDSTEKRKEFEEKLNCILKETAQFTFPFLANQDKKKVIIVEKNVQELFQRYFDKQADYIKRWL